MSNKFNTIIFSSVNWSTHWQIHHQLANSLIESGGKVLFVENTGSRSPQVRDFRRVIDRVKSRFGSIHGFKGVNSNLTIYTPLFVPYPYLRLSIFINTIFISRAINKWKKANFFQSPVCISFLPTPSVQEIINKVNPSLTIYYCADDMSRALSNPNKMLRYESRFFKIADLVFTTSHKLYDKAVQFSDSVHIIPAGVDSKTLFTKELPAMPDDIKHITKPIIGYVGAISDVFDQELVVKLAKSFLDATIVLVGPKYTNISTLKKIENILLLGERSHDLIPSYINSFDIALIPYIVNESTDSVYSCKLNEYLSFGKVVLSTNLQEIKIFNEKNDCIINVGTNTEDFIEKAKRLVERLTEDTEEDRIKRINVAKENTWDVRFSKIVTLINENLEFKLNYRNNWQSALISRYKKSNYLLVSRALFILVFYFLIFHSPLFWLVGEQLTIRDLPKKSDAIVVFSGDGSVNYRNLGYQKRALSAIKLYQQGYADKIFLSSGREQTIADVQMIRLYLESKGVPKSSIYTLEEYPNSTYKHVKMVKKNLNINNVNSILFLTAPYHSLRSVLTWKKNAPNIKVIIPGVLDSKHRDPHWGVALDKMKIILYEVAAIIHNWILGRI